MNELSPKVALVTNMLPPYRVGFYSALAGKVDLHVILNVQSEKNREWKVDTDDLPFDLNVLNSKSIVYNRKRKDLHYTEPREFHLNEKLYGALNDLRPDVVVSMEFGIRTIICAIYCKINKIPLIIGWEGTSHTEKEAGTLKEFVRKRLVKRANRFWSNGLDSQRNLERYGARTELIDNGMTGVPTHHLYEDCQPFLGQRDQIRNELGLKGTVLLFNGSLSPRKGVKQYLDAIDKVAERDEVNEFSLIFLGSGEFGDEVDEWAKKHPSVPVLCTGFIQPAEMPKYFAVADWAVLPTLDDNWPLATLEVLVAGLPQLFSIYNGATDDLCDEEGDLTGYKINPLNTEDFAAKIIKVINIGERRVDDAVVNKYMDYYSSEGQASRGYESIQKAQSQRH